MNQNTESEIEHKQEQQQLPCNCPVCKGQCPRCNKMGCGMCKFCTHTRCPVCPQCATMLESLHETEHQHMKHKMPFHMTFERVILLLILILAGYVAWKHYKE